MKTFNRFDKTHVKLTRSALDLLPFTTEAGYEIPDGSVLVLDTDYDRFLKHCEENNIVVDHIRCGRDHGKNGDLFIPFHIVDSHASFPYMMLGRLKSDCEFFLGNGNRQEKNLWGKTVDGHIAEMKKIWNGFGKYEKPEWISLEEIEEYEKSMKN